MDQQFASLDVFKSTLRAIAVRQRWNAKMLRSSKRHVSIGCRSAPDCPFKVICRTNENNPPHITHLNDTHTCRRDSTGPAARVTRSEISHIRFLLEEVPKLVDMSQKVRGQHVVDAVKRYHGYDLSLRQAQRVVSKLQPRHRKGKSGQTSLANDSPNQQEEQSQVQSQALQETNIQRDLRELENNRDGWLQNQGFHSALLAENLTSPDNTQQSPAAHNYRAMTTHEPSTTGPHISNNIQYPQNEGQEHLNEPLHQAHNSQQVSNDIRYPPETTQTPNNTHSQSISQLPPQNPSDDSIENQLLLSNFKIEFKCTSCGCLNRSFIPIQGPTSGDNAPNRPIAQNLD